MRVDAPSGASGGLALAGAQALPRTDRRGVDVLTLSLVFVVVALVTLPRLFDFARQENEEDAVWLVRTALEELSVAGSAARPAALGELFARSPRLARQFRDRRLLDGGRLVHHHGYFFAIVSTESDARVLGWPTHFGRTGVAAVLGIAGRAPAAPPELLGHAHAAEHGRPELPADVGELRARGWQHVALRE